MDSLCAFPRETSPHSKPCRRARSSNEDDDEMIKPEGLQCKKHMPPPTPSPLLLAPYILCLHTDLMLGMTTRFLAMWGIGAATWALPAEPNSVPHDWQPQSCMVRYSYVQKPLRLCPDIIKWNNTLVHRWLCFIRSGQLKHLWLGASFDQVPALTGCQLWPATIKRNI